MRPAQHTALLLLGALATIARLTATVHAGGDVAAVAAASRIDTSLVSAARFLTDAQSPDGAWRSKVYGPLRDGPSLSPYVLTALYSLQPAHPPARESFRRGRAYVLDLLDDTGQPRDGLSSPVYTAAAATWLAALHDDSGDAKRSRAAWLAYLRARQLTTKLGWDQSAPEFGGWGYSVPVPRKPPPGEPRGPLVESNLSATVYGLGALRLGGVPPDDSAYGDVLTFVKRCQNFADDRHQSDPAYDDGGFFFIPDDPAKNKAGVAGTDRHGRRRYHSYGGPTADGLRCLLHAGLPATDPRVKAARRWLERNFDPDNNPGAFEEDREVLRNATYYYYCWSAAHAFMHLNAGEIGTDGGRVRWAEAMADALLKRQQPDGSWSNEFTDTKEDDPLVATPAAAAALVICRRVIAGDGGGRVQSHGEPENLTPR
jgi:hypothetical protein